MKSLLRSYTPRGNRSMLPLFCRFHAATLRRCATVDDVATACRFNANLRESIKGYPPGDVLRFVEADRRRNPRLWGG